MNELQHKQLLVAQIFCSLHEYGNGMTITPEGYYESVVDESITIAEQIIQKTLKTHNQEVENSLFTRIGKMIEINTSLKKDEPTEHNDY